MKKQAAENNIRQKSPPDGYYMGSVKVGPKGQIVIPKEVRQLFGIEPGETLLLLADINRGIAMNKYTALTEVVNKLFEQNGGDGK